MPYKAFIFDLFGTLAERFPVPLYEQVLDRMAESLSLPCDTFKTEWRRCYLHQEEGRFARVHEAIEVVCRVHRSEPSPQQIAQAAELLPQFIERVCQPRHDAPTTLAHLRSTGALIGLISNCPPEVPRVWHRFPLARSVDCALFSCVAGIRKPDPEIYRLAASQLRLEPSACLFVGDGGAYELSGANSAGMDAVLLAVGDESDPHNLSPEARVWQGKRVSSLRELIGSF